MIGFRVQAFLFESKVHSVVSRLERLQLDQSSEREVLRSLPELKPGIVWNFYVNGRPDETCHGDSCYVLRDGNVWNGLVFRLRERMNYQRDWIFWSLYWLGHRYQSFASYVEIRNGKVSRYEYALAVSDQEYPLGGLVGVHVLGADRASFPAGYGFFDDYSEIAGFRTRQPSNMIGKVLYVAFTPSAQATQIHAAFDVHLDCLWSSRGCSATKQILPGLWKSMSN